MDALLLFTDAEPDGDLMVSRAHGVAWQADMTVTARYDARYFDHYVALQGSPIAQALNAGRVALVDRHVGAGARVVDVGIGSGEFIAHRPNTYGQDINPQAVAWLRERGLWADHLSDAAGVTFWDVIEHVREPDIYLRQIAEGACVFVSIPVFDDLSRVRASKHYKPGEHLYYWTAPGFVAWMAARGFGLLERTDFETAAGRDGIATFAFRRCATRC